MAALAPAAAMTALALTALVIALALAVALGFAIGWLTQRRRAAAARARLGALARSIIKAGHDLRGTLSPALLTADALTTHPDPAVRDAAERIAQGIETAASGLQAPVTLARPDAGG